MTCPRLPVRLCCIALAVFLPAVFGLVRFNVGNPANQALSWTVEIEHFGVDPVEIERSITIPLEDSVSAIAGCAGTESSSEIDRSRLIVRMTPHADPTGFFLSLREAVDRIHASLPPTVQKPRIYPGDDRDLPFFIVALGGDDEVGLRDWAEKTLKPELLKLPGIGNVDVGGGRLSEVHIRLQEQGSAATGVSASALASMLSSSIGRFSSGLLETRQRRTQVGVDARIQNLDELRSLPLRLSSGQVLRVSDLATVERGYREQDSISRVDGKQRICLSVQSDGSSISRSAAAVRALLSVRLSPDTTSIVLLDAGAQLDRSVKELVVALLAGSVASFLLLVFASGNTRMALVVAASIPSTLLLCLGWPSLLGISIPIGFLHGCALSIGPLADLALVICWTTKEPSRNGAILAASACSLIVLTPLVASDVSFGALASGYAFSITVATVLDLLALPLLFISDAYTIAPKSPNRSATRFRVPFFIWKKWRACICKPFFSGVMLFVLIALLVPAVVLSRSSETSTRSTVCTFHLELPPGSSVLAVDEALKEASHFFKGIAGFNRSETWARKDNGTLRLFFLDSAKPDEALAHLVRQWNNERRDWFLFAEDPGPQGLHINLTLTGPQTSTLRSLASDFAKSLVSNPNFQSTVFHWKDAPPSVRLVLNSGPVARAGMSPSFLAREIHHKVEGPVSLKWIENQTEHDVRIFGSPHNPDSIPSLLRQNIAESGSFLPLGALLVPVSDDENGRTIFRSDRNRCVSLTLVCSTTDSSLALGLVKNAVSTYTLPPQYSFHLDEKLLERVRQQEDLRLYFVLAFFLVWALLSIQADNLKRPMLVLIAVPASLGVCAPLLFTGNTGSAGLTALITAMGMAVNNAVLMTSINTEGSKRSAQYQLNSRLSGLFLSFLIMLGATLPLLFLGPEDGLSSRMVPMLCCAAFGSWVIGAWFLPPVLVKTRPGSFGYRLGTAFPSRRN